MKDIKIIGSEIQLDQFLKYANIVSSGGGAKSFVQQGLVKVNGEEELRRSKKITIGDVVEFDNNSYKVVN